MSKDNEGFLNSRPSLLSSRKCRIIKTLLGALCRSPAWHINGTDMVFNRYFEKLKGIKQPRDILEFFLVFQKDRHFGCCLDEASKKMLGGKQHQKSRRLRDCDTD